MIPAVTGLRQVSQDANTGATVFAWDAVAEADTYVVALDGLTINTVAASASPTVTISGASAGSHTIGVAPVAAATPPTDLAFTVPVLTPGVPTGLTATAVSSTEVDLVCNPDPGATSYVWSRDGAVLQTTTAPSYKDLTVLPATTHTYTVAGSNASGTSAQSAGVPVTTPPASGTPPPAPTGLVATNVTASEVDLACDQTPTATSWNWFRDSQPTGSPTPVPAFHDTTVLPSTTYHYGVQASNAAGNSPRDPNAIDVTTPASGGGTPPPTPKALAVSAVTATTATVTCGQSAGATEYGLELDGVFMPNQATPSWSLTGLTPGSAHTVAVDASNTSGTSAASATVPFTTLTTGSPPPTPTGLAASAVTATTATLKANPATGASNYTFFEGGTALTPSPATPVLNLTGLTPGTTYLFTIAAGNASGESAQSAAISVTTLPATGNPPPTPTGLAASAVTSDSLTLNANPATGATDYTFFEGGTALTPSPATPVLNVVGLAADTEYEFAVAAGNASGESATSAAIPVTTLPASGGGGFLSDLVIIMEENEPASKIVGSSSAPYFNSLLAKGALAEPLNNCHPSQPNYIAAIGGTNYGCNADSPQPWNAVPTTAKSLVDLLEAASIPYWFLMESMPGSLYAIKHDPFVQFPANRNSTTRSARHIAYSDTFWSTWQGGYVWVSPNLTDDGHTAPPGTQNIPNLDKWLTRVVPLILASEPFTKAGSKAVLNISFDESEGTGGNGCVYPGYTPGFVSFWIGPGAKQGYKATGTYQGHYSELATIEAGFGLPDLGQLDAQAPVMRELFP
jgi:hypothetical protein